MLLQEILDEFLLDCRIRNLSNRTIRTYDYQISIFVNYMESELDESNILKLKKTHTKKYVVDLQETKKAT